MTKKNNKKTKKTNNVSKMAIDEEKLKSETTPNPVVLGGLPAIGLTRIPPIQIPKYLLMHPALPRGIELKANRMIKLVDSDLEENVIQNPSENSKTEEAREYCKKILFDSGGPLFLKKMSQGAYRFGTSFAILQTDVAEREVLRFEYLSLHCNITSACTLDTMSFYDTGWINISAIINTSNLNLSGLIGSYILVDDGSGEIIRRI